MDQTTTMILLALLTAAIGGWIGSKKGRLEQGFILGLLFSILGLLVVLWLDPKGAARHAAGRWAADPSGRYGLRWYDGTGWTAWIWDARLFRARKDARWEEVKR